MTTCIVLNSSSPYSAEHHEELLRSLQLEKPDLFAVVGSGCESWEDAMDWLCIELSTSGVQPDAFCNTTSHKNETLEEVIAFADQWCELRALKRDVRVVTI